MGTKYQNVVRTRLDGQLPGDDKDDAFFAQQCLKRVIQPLSSYSV